MTDPERCWIERVFTPLMLGFVVYFAVRMAEPAAGSIQHQINDQIRANTELHTRSRVDRDHLHATEARLMNSQADVLGRLGSLETEVAEMRTKKGSD